MSDQCRETQTLDACDPNQTMSVHVRKITDSCRDKDCIEDLRVYLTCGSQQLLDSAANVRVRSAELIHTYIDVEPVAFDRNHYCIDITFYYRVLADAVVGSCRPTTLYGLAVFNKRAVLCGEDSRAHIFRSDTALGRPDGRTLCTANRPTAVVEVLDPMVLGSKIRDVCECASDTVTAQIPEGICSAFDEELVLSGGQRRLFVTLGQFSIVRLERDAQLVIPVLDYSIPTKECCDASGSCCTEDPCEMFSRIPFPSKQFSPDNCDRNRNDSCSCI